MRFQASQLAMLRNAAAVLKPEGRLIYSTCSSEGEENEDVVQALLREMSILRLEEERSSLPFRENFDGAFAARLRRVD